MVSETRIKICSLENIQFSIISKQNTRKLKLRSFKKNGNMLVGIKYEYIVIGTQSNEI